MNQSTTIRYPHRGVGSGRVVWDEVGRLHKCSVVTSKWWPSDIFPPTTLSSNAPRRPSLPLASLPSPVQDVATPVPPTPTELLEAPPMQGKDCLWQGRAAACDTACHATPRHGTAPHHTTPHHATLSDTTPHHTTRNNSTHHITPSRTPHYITLHRHASSYRATQCHPTQPML